MKIVFLIMCDRQLIFYPWQPCGRDLQLVVHALAFARVQLPAWELLEPATERWLKHDWLLEYSELVDRQRQIVVAN